MQLFSAKEAAERWGISEVWLRELCRKGRVAPCDKVGGTWLIYGNSVILDPHGHVRGLNLGYASDERLREQLARASA